MPPANDAQRTRLALLWLMYSRLHCWEHTVLTSYLACCATQDDGTGTERFVSMSAEHAEPPIFRCEARPSAARGSHRSDF